MVLMYAVEDMPPPPPPKKKKQSFFINWKMMIAILQYILLNTLYLKKKHILKFL